MKQSCITNLITVFFLSHSCFAYAQNKVVPRTSLKVIKQDTLSGKYRVDAIQIKTSKHQKFYLVNLNEVNEEDEKKNKKLQIELKENPKNLSIDDIIMIKAELLKKSKNKNQLAQFAFLSKSKDGLPKLIRYISRHVKDIVLEKPSYLRMHSPSSDYILF